MTSSTRNSPPSSQIGRSNSRSPNGRPHRNQTIDLIEHRIDSELDVVKHWRKNQKSTSLPLQEWEQPYLRQPYHEYVHKLVAGGWENLSHLDNYLRTSAAKQAGLIISVLDVEDGFTKKRWPDLYNDHDLKTFISEQTRDRVKVRLYMAEYDGCPPTSLIEALGGALKLDPRFFTWSINGKSHVLTPSQQHRAPYVNLGFGVLDSSSSRNTDAEKFKVLIYVLPDEHGSGWTGIVLFSSHRKINLSPCILTDPPPFQSQLPPQSLLRPKSFRELYLESLEFVDLKKATTSPFYTVANLLRLNCFCWNQIITSIRQEDHRIKGISDTTVGHAEEIKKSLSVVERGGSLGWSHLDDKVMKETREALEEDFRHLVEQTDLLWETRDQMATIRQRNSETRWNSLTNAFTYLFAPVTIMTGVYGMNVSQISGSNSNPNIWQFFVAVAAMNVAMVLALAISNWIQIQVNHGRVPGLKEVLGFAVGSVNSK